MIFDLKKTVNEPKTLGTTDLVNRYLAPTHLLVTWWLSNFINYGNFEINPYNFLKKCRIDSNDFQPKSKMSRHCFVESKQVIVQFFLQVCKMTYSDMQSVQLQYEIIVRRPLFLRIFFLVNILSYKSWILPVKQYFTQSQEGGMGWY